MKGQMSSSDRPVESWQTGWQPLPDVIDRGGNGGNTENSARIKYQINIKLCKKNRKIIVYFLFAVI